MVLPESKKLKFLYLLALFQLVAGPLVLLQVTVFCKVAVPEISRGGVAAAFEKAWHSDEFHAVLETAAPLRKKGDPQPAPTDPGLAKAKAAPVIPWMTTPFRALAHENATACPDGARVWTPAWPQAPPGPPPRIG